MYRKDCGKRRNCLLQAISPFLTVFTKDLYCRLILLKPGLVWERVNSLPDHKNLHCSKFKAFADINLNLAQVMEFVFDRFENIVVNGKKCWLPAFSPFPTMFSKGFLCRVIKNRDSVVKG